MALSPGCADCRAEGIVTRLVTGPAWQGGQFAAGERLTVSGGPPPVGRDRDPGQASRRPRTATPETLIGG